MVKTDILIIGAGPAGLFTVFEAGLLKMRCHWRQCAAVLVEKKIVLRIKAIFATGSFERFGEIVEYDNT